MLLVRLSPKSYSALRSTRKPACSMRASTGHSGSSSSVESGSMACAAIFSCSTGCSAQMLCTSGSSSPRYVCASRGRS